ncbi:MAG: hypothetical protein Ct9H300mP1_37630 [Planctomycetaceae bacterium]|nr:MAG: hypothetical protein Ct9H300mP1_37630 [Planctomycetaceae bacterium]
MGRFNRQHLDDFGEDGRLEARINSFELAFRMQGEIPGIQDLSQESSATHKLYGLDEKITEDFGRQCLLARRFLERGPICPGTQATPWSSGTSTPTC